MSGGHTGASVGTGATSPCLGLSLHHLTSELRNLRYAQTVPVTSVVSVAVFDDRPWLSVTFKVGLKSVPVGTDFVLYSVSCIRPGECTAVGVRDYSRTDAPGIYTTETHGVWNPIELTHRDSADFVSCSHIGDCTAVGSDGYQRADYANETNGIWISGGYLPPVGSDLFNGLRCVDAALCIAVGHPAFAFGSIYAIERNGTWGPLTDVALPDGGRMDAISCIRRGVCTVVGRANGGLIAATYELGRGSPGRHCHQHWADPKGPNWARGRILRPGLS